MKKLLWIILLLPFMTYADTINLECPSSVKEGNVFTCNLTADSSNMISSFSGKILLNSSLEFVSFTPKSNFQGTAVNMNIELYNANDLTGKFNIGEIKLKKVGTDDGNISINNVTFFDNNYKEIAVSSTSMGIVSEVVNKKVEDTSKKNNSNNNVVNNTNNEKDKVIDDSNKEDINILDDNKDLSNIRLNNLIIENHKIDFKPDVYDYTINISKDETKLNITALLDEELSYIVLGNENIHDGSEIIIEVTSSVEVVNYKLHIVLLGKNNNKDYKYVFIAIIALLVAINIIRIIKKNK